MMKRIHFIACLCALISGCGRPPAAKPEGLPERIISLAPNLTETVYLLGLGDKLVGTTAYCTWPVEAKAVPNVGGFGQFNFEAIVSQQPDLVILLKGRENEMRRLDELGIPYLAVEASLINSIMNSIAAIGEACGASEQADALLQQMDTRLAQPLQHPGRKPSVLMTFGGDAASIDQIHAFGADSLHHELLERAGGINAVQHKLPFTTLSTEAVIRLNPDVIIQLSPDAVPPQDPSKPWKKLAAVTAVKENRIYVLNGDYICIPGPRFIQILDDLAEVLQQ